MLEILSRIPNLDIFIITKLPPKQYSISKIRNKEISEEIKIFSECEKAIIVCDDILGASDGGYIYQFFIGGGHSNLYKYYLSQSYFDLPKRTIQNDSNKKNSV